MCDLNFFQKILSRGYFNSDFYLVFENKIYVYVVDILLEYNKGKIFFKFIYVVRIFLILNLEKIIKYKYIRDKNVLWM